MSVNIPILLIAGLTLVLYAHGSKAKPGSLPELRTRIREAVRTAIGIFGWSALAATAILVLQRVFANGNVEAQNLRQLNADIAYYHELLGKSWIVILLLLLALLAGAWLIKVEISKATATHAGRVIKGTGFVKAVVAILATCSFIGGDLHGRLGERVEEAELAKSRLADMQLQLFSKTERALVQELVENVLDDAENENGAFRQIRSAYGIAAPYVDQPPSVDAAVLPDDRWRSRDTPDLSTRQAHQSIATLEMEIDMGDLSVNVPVEAKSPKDLLAEQMVEIVLDEHVAKPIKDYLLSFGNPVIDGLVRALLSPVFLDPAKKVVKVEAAKLLTGKTDLAAARARMRAAAKPLAQRLSAALGGSRSPGSARTLGEPVWDAVRLKMQAGIARGLKNKPAETQNDARAMSGEFSKVRDALRLVLARAPDATGKGERAFARYLARNPDYAAIWGYGVIAFTPPQYEDALKAVSLKQLPERGEVNLHGDIGTVPATSQNAEFIYQHHGPYPIDGYRLYAEKSGVADAIEAASYYRSREVAAYVGKYCPASST